MKKKILFICIALVATVTSQAQQASLHIDTNHILIGDHVNMDITYQPANSTILFPQICDTCIAHLEIISRSNIDTININGVPALHQRYVITGFENGMFYIPALTFYATDSSIMAQTTATMLKISTVKVDTNMAIKDIKPPLRAPLTFKEILPYIGGALVIALLIVGIIWLIRHYNNKRKPSHAAPAKPLEPAEVIALRDLDALWQKKLCEKGHYKEFYSSLSLITRTYIYNQWDIASLEMVTSEVCLALKATPTTPDDIHHVQQALEMADLVKFAKATPLDFENKNNYDAIVNFVKNTAPVTTTKDN